MGTVSVCIDGCVPCTGKNALADNNKRAFKGYSKTWGVLLTIHCSGGG